MSTRIQSLGDYAVSPTDVSVLRHRESAQLCVFWTARPTWTPSESWDKQCWGSPCFRKKKADQNTEPLIFPSPPDVWLWIITRYQEFADFSLWIVLQEMKDFSLIISAAADARHKNESAPINSWVSSSCRPTSLLSHESWKSWVVCVF